MKKLLIGLTLVAVIACGIVAMAGQVYDRETVTITDGAATWTNDYRYAAVELKRIWIEASTVAADTVTVYRVTSDGTYTQACATVTFTSGSKGNSASFTAAHLKYGDKLLYSGGAGSNSVSLVDLEVQQH